ncbi:hypothetical protein FA15DRAFT_705433 [Coprinopsis marcescibilis]|uniref:Uncharacterized protein n=1 Tax=Coprinopsis marcescibilis TaxID=230819 RepID=A0A5C3KS85_COPMA|nr:hypothetical protein FA15DRAFT_705433 [Coprinopsis marcescibilis]
MSELDLEHLGLEIGIANYTGLLISTLATGIQSFVTVYCLSIFFETSQMDRKGRKPYIVAGFLIALVNFLRTATDMPSVFNTTFRATSGMSFTSTAHWDANQGWDYKLGSICNTLIFVLADGLLLYRCYIVLHGLRWLIVLPTLTYIGTIAFGIILDLTTILKFLDSPARFTISVAEPARVGLSVATNVLITAFVGYRLAMAERSLARVLSLENTRAYTGATHLLVESTLPLSILGICYAAIRFAEIRFISLEHHLHLLVAHPVLEELYFSCLALSPQIIILRVTTGRSWMRAPELTSPLAAFSHSLAFAREPHGSLSALQSNGTHEHSQSADADVSPVSEDIEKA